MRLFLQQKPDGGESPKFVQLILEQDLLGGWSLVKESGFTGGRSQLKREQFLQHDAAIMAFEKARDNQVKRGFQIMFVQGAEAP
jgi:predicted DNA-binding WGR domain protein